MPLRDHFHAPLNEQSSWEGLHGQWPAMIVLELARTLPLRYVAEPRVHIGTEIEIDVATFDKDESAFPLHSGGTEYAYEPAEPSVAVETELPSISEYEVRIFDTKRNRRLVAAVEIVSPSNKDRPESRRVFVTKCDALLRQGVSVAIVDLVTTPQFNLYLELMEFLGQRDPTMSESSSATSAAACRWTERNGKFRLETWSHALQVGQPLPTLPLWLSENLAVPLELEASYELTCRALRIPAFG